MTQTAQKIRSSLTAALTPYAGRHIGIAVSGGSDSTALMCGIFEVMADLKITVSAVTVNHGLRAEAVQEAGFVADLCTRLDVPHDVLSWDGWDGTGNLQDAARRARYGLISAWAQDRGINAVALGHTADDQAETVLMRLGRSAGVTGLSAMAPERTSDGVTWMRPLLTIRRDELRDTLTRQGQTWCDDPSNENLAFDRIKARKALEQLENLGVTVQALTEVATHMQQADHALRVQTHQAAHSLVTERFGALRFERSAFFDLPDEIARRLVNAALRWIAGAPYAPRRSAVAGFMEAMRTEAKATLSGCVTQPEDRFFWIYRELEAVADEISAPGAAWDGRWAVTHDAEPRAEARAMGDAGLKQLGDWRRASLPRDVLMSTPALWLDGDVIGASGHNLAVPHRIKLTKDRDDFAAFVLSH